jgi:hypothetical protein
MSYNLIIFYKLAHILVICPFLAILFSLSASYNLIMLYELALSLVKDMNNMEEKEVE